MRDEYKGYQFVIFAPSTSSFLSINNLGTEVFCLENEHVKKKFTLSYMMSVHYRSSHGERNGHTKIRDSYQLKFHHVKIKYYLKIPKSNQIIIKVTGTFSY